jgi:hypothetical protein
MRWTQLDPSGQDPGYVFAGDDPVNEEDLSGTSLIGDIIGAVGGCALGLEGAFGAAIATAIGTGGEPFVPGAELAFSCGVGATAGVKEVNKAGSGLPYETLNLYNDFGR